MGSLFLRPRAIFVVERQIDGVLLWPQPSYFNARTLCFFLLLFRALVSGHREDILNQTLPQTGGVFIMLLSAFEI